MGNVDTQDTHCRWHYGKLRQTWHLKSSEYRVKGISQDKASARYFCKRAWLLLIKPGLISKSSYDINYKGIVTMDPFCGLGTGVVDFPSHYQLKLQKSSPFRDFYINFHTKSHLRIRQWINPTQSSFFDFLITFLFYVGLSGEALSASTEPKLCLFVSY